MEALSEMVSYCEALWWRHKERDGLSNHRLLDCLHNHFRRRSKTTSKLRVTGLCEGNSSVTNEFPAQRASNEENVSVWWRHHGESTGDRWIPLKGPVMEGLIWSWTNKENLPVIWDAMTITWCHCITIVNKQCNRQYVCIMAQYLINVRIIAD